MIPPSDVTLAAAAYPADWHNDWDGFANKLERWVSAAATQGADIAVFPEYAGLEAALIGQRVSRPVADWCDRAAKVAGRFVALGVRLAVSHGVILVMGSLPVAARGVLVNRAYMVSPDGRITWQDKHVLTPWERSATPLSAVRRLRVEENVVGRVATLICYDSEFPTLSRALMPDFLLIPSCTEAASGLARVQLAARARALEAQCVTVHATLIGAVPECEIIDTNQGQAGIYGPPDHGFPDGGILAQGEANVAGWTFATIAAGALSHTREIGAVAPRAHWTETETIDRTQVTLRRVIQNRP